MINSDKRMMSMKVVLYNIKYRQLARPRECLSIRIELNVTATKHTTSRTNESIIFNISCVFISVFTLNLVPEQYKYMRTQTLSPSPYLYSYFIELFTLKNY